KGKEIPLQFSYCHVGGCTAETVASKEIIEKMKKGNEVVVIFTNSLNKRLGLPLPLSGFTKAYEGKPYPTKKYQEKIRAFLAEVQKKQLELAKRARAAAQKKQSGGGAQQAAPPKQQTAPKKKP
ncbi:MAG: invasion associated locus B family protein, partial [Methyloligellaceae bacterium]